MPTIKPRPIHTEQKLAEKLARMCRKGGVWPAAEYPVNVKVGVRHAVWHVTMTMNTGRVFDIKVKERRP